MRNQYFDPFLFNQSLNDEIKNREEKQNLWMKQNLNKCLDDTEHINQIIDCFNIFSQNYYPKSSITSFPKLKHNLIENCSKYGLNKNLFLEKEVNIPSNENLRQNKNKLSKSLKKSKKGKKSKLEEASIKKTIQKLTKQTLIHEEISINFGVIEKQKPELKDVEVQMGDIELQIANSEGHLRIPSLDIRNKCNFCDAILKNRRSLGGHMSRHHRNMNPSYKILKEKRKNSERTRSRTRMLLAKIKFYKEYEKIELPKESLSKNFQEIIKNKDKKKAFLKIKEEITEDLVSDFLNKKNQKLND